MYLYISLGPSRGNPGLGRESSEDLEKFRNIKGDFFLINFFFSNFHTKTLHIWYGFN